VAVALNLRARVRKQFRQGFSLDVSLDLAGGFHILFGASGAGKTTLLDCIAGLTDPDDGKIALGERTLLDTWAGVNVATHQRRVGYVLQSQALFPHLSVRQNIAFGLPETREAAVEAFAHDLQIGDLLARPPGELSAGQRQRVALARTLITEPQCLLMDEPLAALDTGTKATMLDVLRDWNQQRQIPILYVTHDREEAYSLGDQLAVIEDGRVAATGPPQQVLSAPARQAVAQLAGFENQLRCRIVAEHPEQGTMTCCIAGTEVALEAPLTRVSGEVILGIRAGDILLASEQPRGISARNVLRGTVESVERRGVLVRLLLNAGGAKFEAHVTPGAQIALGLSGGKTVWLVIKTYSCHLLSA
jgi:molybdate transport system ATP-binding protein